MPFLPGTTCGSQFPLLDLSTGFLASLLPLCPSSLACSISVTGGASNTQDPSSTQSLHTAVSSAPGSLHRPHPCLLCLSLDSYTSLPLLSCLYSVPRIVPSTHKTLRKHLSKCGEVMLFVRSWMKVKMISSALSTSLSFSYIFFY